MHPDPSDIHAHLEGVLSKQEDPWIADHLEACSLCKEVSRECLHLQDTFTQAFQSLEPPASQLPDPHQSLKKFQTRMASVALLLPSAQPTLEEGGPSELSKAEPPKGLPQTELAKAEPLKPQRWKFGLWSLSWAAAFGSLCFLGAGLLPLERGGALRPSVSETPEFSLRMKSGGFQAFALVARKGAPSIQVKDGLRLAPGDLLQFTLRLPVGMHCLVVGLHQKGEIFVYLPLQEEKSVFFSAGEHTYPKGASMELDDALGKERFFLFLHPEPLPVAEIRKRLADDYRAAKGDPEKVSPPLGSWKLATFWIEKAKLPTPAPAPLSP